MWILSDCAVNCRYCEVQVCDYSLSGRKRWWIYCTTDIVNAVNWQLQWERLDLSMLWGKDWRKYHNLCSRLPGLRIPYELWSNTNLDRNNTHMYVVAGLLALCQMWEILCVCCHTLTHTHGCAITCRLEWRVIVEKLSCHSFKQHNCTVHRRLHRKTDLYQLCSHWSWSIKSTLTLSQASTFHIYPSLCVGDLWKLYVCHCVQCLCHSVDHCSSHIK